jgi:hypothetical protein
MLHRGEVHRVGFSCVSVCSQVSVGYFVEEEIGVTTVTHFNIIHHACHREV